MPTSFPSRRVGRGRPWRSVVLLLVVCALWLGTSVCAQEGDVVASVSPSEAPEPSDEPASDASSSPSSTDGSSGEESANGDEDGDEDASLESEDEAPTPAPTEAGPGKLWTPVTQLVDVPDFFFAIRGDEPVAGKAFFSFTTIRDGLQAPGYLGLVDGAIRERSKLDASQHFVLRFPGDDDVVIANKVNGSFWKANVEARTIDTVSDFDAATRFKMFTNERKDTLIVKTGDLYLRASHAKQDDPVTLSPVLVGRSFFIPWKSAAGMNATAMDEHRRARQTEIIKIRRKASLGNPTYVAYDLALALLTNKTFDSFPVHKVNGRDLAVIIDEATDMVTSNILAKEYKARYPCFAKDLPDDFDLFTWSAVVKAEGQLPWQEMINAAQRLVHTTSSPLRDNFRTIVLANFQAIDADEATEMTLFNGTIIYEAYFTASCNLVWLSRGNKTLGELVDSTRFPPIKNATLAAAHLAPLPGKVEEYWFTKLLTTNITGFEYSATTIFPEIALLKHIPPEWVSQHSWIGESIVKQFTKRIDKALKEHDISSIVAIFATSERAQRELVQTAMFVCKPASQISFCVIPYLYKMAASVAVYTKQRSLPNVPLDLRPTSNMDVKKYMTLHKNEQRLAAQIDNIVKIKTEAKLLSDEMFSDVAETMESGTLETMVKVNKQLQKDAEASRNQVVNASQIQIETSQAIVDTKLELVNSAFKAAKAAHDPLIKTIQAIGKEALSATTQASFFEVAKVGLSVGNRVQTMVSSKESGASSAIGAVADVRAKFKSMNATMKDMDTASGLMKALAEVAPQMENVSVAIAEKIPALERIRGLAVPLVKSNNKSQFANESDQIAAAVTELREFDLPTKINRLNGFFNTIISQMCALTKRPAFTPCVDVLKYLSEFFGNIQASVEASNAALSALNELISSIADMEAAEESLASISGTTGDNSMNMEKLKGEYDASKDGKDLILFRMRKQQDIDAALATQLAFQSQIAYSQLMYMVCARLTMQFGGRIPPICSAKIMKYMPVTDQELNKLIAFDPQYRPRKTSISAFLPTKPQFPGDTGFIDLSRLMNGQSVAFRLPMNETWLHQFKWLSPEDSVDDSYITLKAFKLFLPPRYTDDDEEVTIEVQSQGLSDLGPAIGAFRYVQLAPIKFVINYNTETCSSKMDPNPYGKCGAKLKDLCFQKSGVSESKDGGLSAPLFSQFVVTAAFESNAGKPKAFAYRALATSMLLRVKAELDVATGEPERRALREAVVEAAEAVSSSRCCDTGSYLVEPSPKKKANACMRCPPGSVSQLGGLFCAYTPLPSRDTTVATARGLRG